MHIFGYVTNGFQSLNHSVVLSSLVFLGVLVVLHVIPTFMSHRIKAAKVRQTSTIERAFLLDEISRSKTKLESFRLIYLKIWSKVRHFLSFFDWIRFCRYLSNIEQIKQKQIRTKHFNTINWLRRQRFGSSNLLVKRFVIYLVTIFPKLKSLF